MDGKQSQKSISVTFYKVTVPVILEYAILFGVGIVAILLHSRLRTPLNLPGHHGLEFMALMMAGRIASRIPWASSISSMGIGLVLLFPAFGFSDPFMGINYMIPGLVIDLVFNLTKNFSRQLLILSLIAGLAYMMIPLSRLFIHLLTAYPYQSFIKHGTLIPLLGYFAFGMAGGFTGAGITGSVIKKIRKK